MRSVSPAKGKVIKSLPPLFALLILLLAACYYTKVKISPIPATSTPTIPPATPTTAALPKTPAPTPYRITIPDIGVEAPIVAVGVEPDGTMVAPPGPDVVGWYAGGPRPGQRGNVLLTGHRDWHVGPRTAIFWRLGELMLGSRVLIYDEATCYTYVVRDTVRYRFDDPLIEVFLQPSAETIITIATCEGVFDTLTHNYDYRRIVVAELREYTTR